MGSWRVDAVDPLAGPVPVVFWHCTQQVSLRGYVDGLLSDSPRKSMQPVLARITEPRSYQAFHQEPAPPVPGVPRGVRDEVFLALRVSPSDGTPAAARRSHAHLSQIRALTQEVFTLLFLPAIATGNGSSTAGD
jgi:hypothetical protein